MTQHAGLTVERWADFSLEQQVLMIGNEMQRAAALSTPSGLPALRRAYERILRLVDLSVAVSRRPTLRRELLRWRELIAALYVAPAPDPEAHAEAFACLLRFTPGSARQLPHLRSSAAP